MNPEDAAAERFKPIRQARERIAQAEQTFTAAMARLEDLRGKVGPAELRDRERLGEALVAGKSEPPAEAEQLKEEVARQELRVEALRLAADRARARIRELVAENRDSWRRQARRELGRERQRYEAAISEVQAARGALVNVATLIGWLERADYGQATTGLPLDRMIAELRNDAEQLAAHPDIPRGGPQPEPRFELATGGTRGMRVSDWGR